MIQIEWDVCITTSFILPIEDFIQFYVFVYYTMSVYIYI